MEFLIDTSVIIDHLCGLEPVTRWLRERVRAGAVATSVIVLSELVFGARSTHATERIKEMLADWPVLPIGATEAWNAGELRRDLAQQGQAISLADALIGATALRHGLVVATSNTKDFPFVSCVDPRVS